MWEAVATPGRRDDLARWALDHFAGDVYVSADERVVAVVDDPPDGDPVPPEDLVARPPHAWDFTRLPRS
jgi:hypothetical protein